MKNILSAVLAAFIITSAVSAATHEGGFIASEWVIPTDVTPSAPSEKQYDR